MNARGIKTKLLRETNTMVDLDEQHIRHKFIGIIFYFQIQ